MEDIILKIIRKNYTDYGIKVLREGSLASELSELMEKFNEWKDQRINSGKIIWHEGFYFYAKKYSHSELFTYWYEEIYNN